MSKRKPSAAQLGALRRTKNWSEEGSYMPFASDTRTFEACLKYGWLKATSVDRGDRRNGYALTQIGELLLQPKDPTHDP